MSDRPRDAAPATPATPATPTTIDARLAASWADGLFRGDAAILRAVAAATAAAADPRADELAALAALAALIEGEPAAPLAAPSPDAPARVQVIAHAARAWLAVRAGDPALATDAIGALDAALARLDDAEPRRAAAEAFADLALAECALVADDRFAARRRLRRIVRGRAPTGTAIAARLALALRAMRGGEDDPAAGLAFLDEAAALAAAAGRPIDQAIALCHAGVLALAHGDEAGGVARLERAVAVAPAVGPSELAMARVLLASTRDGAAGLDDLAAGMRIAAAAGDHAGYLVLVLAGARRTVALGALADAIAILDHARDQLAPLGPLAVRALDDEKARLRAAVGDDAFAAASREADQKRARDRARVGHAIE